MDRFNLYYMNAAALLDCTIAVYRKSFSQQLLVTMIMGMVSGVAIIALMVVLGVLGFIGFANELTAAPDLSAGMVVFICFALLLCMGVFMMLSSVTLVANMSLTEQVFNGEKPNIGKAFSVAMKAIVRLFTVSVAMFIVYIPVLVVLGFFIWGIVSANAVLWDMDIMNTDAMVWSMFGWIVALSLGLTFVGIVIGAFTCLSVPVALFENRYFFGAVGKGFQLVKKDFWKVMGLLVLITLMLVGIQESFNGIFSILSGVMTGIGAELGEGAFALAQLASMVGMVVSIGTSLVIGPITGVFTSLLYLNQKMKHEGFDISRDIALLPRKDHTPTPPPVDDVFAFTPPPVGEML